MAPQSGAWDQVQGKLRVQIITTNNLNIPYKLNNPNNLNNPDEPQACIYTSFI